MSIELIPDCLDLMDEHGPTSPIFNSYFLRVKADLLENDDIAIGLVVLIGHLKDEAGDALVLLGLLLDEARMGLENDGAHASDFLANVEMAIEAGFEAGAFEGRQLMEFAAQYQRVGLPIPNSLLIDPDEMPLPKDAEDIDPSESLEKIAMELLANGGSPYDLFSGLDEMTAVMPDNMKAGFANHLATLPDPVFGRCALYYVLTGSALVQEAAVAGLFERLNTLDLPADVVKLLPNIRGWLPSGETRAAVDALIKQARRKGVGEQVKFHEPCRLLEINTTITDGVGAQSISIIAERGGKVAVAMLLTKDGYGVKDAFVMPCEDLEEAESMVIRSKIEADAAPVSLSTITVLLEAAFADGVDNGCLPAPGILDVLETCDLLELRPQTLSLQRLLEVADPDRKIQNASAQSLGRWINSEDALELLEPLTDSWFEDSEETRNIVATTKSFRTVQTKIWKYLEKHRDLWARRFLQTAVMLKDAEQLAEWQTLTASAHGLMTGRALKRIPLMEEIVFITIDAAESQM